MKTIARAGSKSRLTIAFMVFLLPLLGCLAAGVALDIVSAGLAHAGDARIYVDQDAGGASTGLSWTDAYTDLQDALAVAGPGTEIWVAEGTYMPTRDSDRSVSFALKGAVALYGGFNGDEVNREERDWLVFPTILSGDIGGLGTTDDNSYHVVTATNVLSTTIVDGFTVTGGNADGTYPDQSGGGMYSLYSDLTLAHLVFTGNFAISGGGFYNEYGSPTLTNVSFISNTGGLGGGMQNVSNEPHLTNVSFIDNYADGGAGLNNASSNPTLINVVFIGNRALTGGGLYNHDSKADLTNVLFTGNFATFNGGGMLNDLSTITLTNGTFSGNATYSLAGGISNRADSILQVSNSILWGNIAGLDMDQAAQINNEGGTITMTYSLVQGGVYTGTGNLSSDPLFIDPDGLDDLAGTADDDLRLTIGSPAVDAGDNRRVPPDSADLDGDGNMAEPIPLDLAGQPRFFDVPSRADTGIGPAPLIDLGAYETIVNAIYLPTMRR